MHPEGQTGGEGMSAPQKDGLFPDGDGSQGSSSELLHELPRPPSLAEELGVGPRPEGEYQEIDQLCSEIFAWEIFQGLIGMNVKEIPVYLAQHTRDILPFFNDRSANSYRLLLFLRQASYAEVLGRSSFKEGLAKTQLAQANECFLIFVAFYLISNITAELTKFAVEARQKALQNRIGLAEEIARMQIECDLRVNFSDKMVGFIWTILGSKYNSFFETFSVFPKFPKVEIESEHAEVFLVQQMILGYIKGNHECGRTPERLFMHWENLYSKVVPESSSIPFEKSASLRGVFLAAKDAELGNEQDSYALDYFLCQENLVFHSVFLAAFRNKSYLPVWKVWIARHIARLADRKSETHRICCQVFAPGITSILVRKRDTWKVSGSARQHFPAELVKVFEESANACPDLIPPELPSSVDAIPPSVANKTAFVLDRGERPTPEEPEPTIVLTPPEQGVGIHELFPNYVSCVEKRTQLDYLYLAHLKSLPVGTMITLNRTTGKKGKSEQILSCELPTDENQITIPQIENFSGGNISYCLACQLPNGHIFSHPRERQYEIEARYYINSNIPIKPITVPQREIITRQAWTSDAQKNVANHVASVLTPNPEAESLEMLQLILEEQNSPLVQAVMVDDSVVQITINNNPVDEGQHLFAADGTTLLPIADHCLWTVTFNKGSVLVAPEIDNPIQSILISLAEKTRQAKREQESKQLEEMEYQGLRARFAPLLDFLESFLFSDADFADRLSAILPTVMSGWKMPHCASSGQQVTWRCPAVGTNPEVRIIYTTRACDFFHIAFSPNQNISSAQDRFFTELAKLFGPIAEYLCAAKGKPQKSVVAKYREVTSLTEGYEKALTEDRARLMIVGPKDLIQDPDERERFPSGNTPRILTEQHGGGAITIHVGNDTIEDILGEHPDAQLLLRADSVRFQNGYFGREDACKPEVDVYESLRNSPRARDILRDRILITLGLKIFPHDEMRDPINGGSHGEVSALHIVETVASKYGIQRGNLEQENRVDANFINDFIDGLEQHGIPVQYVRAFCSTLEDHQTEMRKILRARARKQAKVEDSTADGSHQIVA